ncbi:MAG: hypothetical protein BWY72_02533 [Bacteroidetes bacterium ADurb.Bin416]|nr:MAG: hypothetical protein BWY72_02533 [Bacteroidetes bacterium ADurb.Bin416]
MTLKKLSVVAKFSDRNVMATNMINNANRGLMMGCLRVFFRVSVFMVGTFIDH